jgi:TetR/AcrR family transcriptional regulator, regulator of cefoperazone and chloramphenicol sensitivity
MTGPGHDEGPAYEDLTARARIRDAALRQFAEHGYARATIREISRAAGVSPGLVQHHFGSKEALRQACDDYALDQMRRYTEKAAAEMAAAEEGAAGSDSTAEEWLALQQSNQLYLARALIDDSPAAASIFDEMVEIGERSLMLADEQRQDPPVVDRRTRATLMVAMALGVPAFNQHVSRVIGVDILSTGGLRQIAVALLDIHSHPVISPELAATLREGFGEIRDSPPTEPVTPRSTPQGGQEYPDE